MNEAYRKHVTERDEQGLPPLPLTEELVKEVLEGLDCGAGGEDTLALLSDRVAPGVDPAARIKANWLAAVARGEGASPLVDRREAVRLLGTMLGGYNVPFLVELLDDVELAPVAATALKQTLLVLENFDTVAGKATRGNRFAMQVLESWAEGEWFTARPALPETISVAVFKVDGEINTDDLSPAQDAPTRPDIPLHALSMGKNRFPGGLETIAQLRRDGHQVAFVGQTVGTGSSRKSATNSLIWHIGEDIPYVPNKRRGGIVIGEQIAPIFFNTFEDSGGLPLRVDSVEDLQTGDVITIDTAGGEIRSADDTVLARFELSPLTLADEYRAGGRVPLLIGRKLTEQAQRAIDAEPKQIFVESACPEPKEGQGYSLAQKMVGRACGKTGVLPGETCMPRIATVGSQDTTGPMTRDELVELACLSFQAPMTMQSFCHTAAYPTDRDKNTHATLPDFFSQRGGVALRPGDGIVHSWLNRLLVPDTVGTGGDSHTRFPLGVSFPAGSGLVAFAAALGTMPLDMPESVLVKFEGSLPAGITLRDVVNAIPLKAIEMGLQSPYGEGSENVFNSRILEMEGLPDVSVEQAFELSCAAAERSAAAATIALSNETVSTYLRSNVTLMKNMIAEGYQAPDALRSRVKEVEAWLASPALLERDGDAAFASTIVMDLSDIGEPALACPNNPDNVAWLSEHAGTAVDEVFIGSCMTNIAHFRAAAKIFSGPDCEIGVKRLWLTPPTRMDREQLSREGIMQLFDKLGARTEMPGCSLCMGNQARVDDNAVVFSTSTRNFNDRMGQGAQVFLGSAELAAIVAKLGEIPSVDTYFEMVAERITPHQDEIYRYLSFDQMQEYVARART